MGGKDEASQPEAQASRAAAASCLGNSEPDRQSARRPTSGAQRTPRVSSQAILLYERACKLALGPPCKGRRRGTHWGTRALLRRTRQHEDGPSVHVVYLQFQALKLSQAGKRCSCALCAQQQARPGVCPRLIGDTQGVHANVMHTHQCVVAQQRGRVRGCGQAPRVRVNRGTHHQDVRQRRQRHRQARTQRLSLHIACPFQSPGRLERR